MQQLISDSVQILQENQTNMQTVYSWADIEIYFLKKKQRLGKDLKI